MSSTVVIPPADLFPTTGTGDAVLATSPTLVTPISASLTAPASTALTLTGGSTGASLVLGQGANGAITTTLPGTGLATVVGTISATGSGAGTDGAVLRVRNNTTTVTTAPAYVLGINRQNSGVGAIYLGNDANNAGVIATNNTDLRLGKDFSGTFSELTRFTTTGNLLIGGTTDIPGSGGLKVFGTTAASTSQSGAFQVGGSTAALSVGIGGGNVNAGGGITGATVNGSTYVISPLYIAPTTLTLRTNGGSNTPLVLSGDAATFAGAVTTAGRLQVGSALTTYIAEVREDAASVTGLRVKNDSPSASAYSQLAVNAFGNSWGFRMGSTAANSNALQFISDITAPAVRFSMTPAGITSLTNSTASSGVGTGALQVAGGIYAGAASVFGGQTSFGTAFTPLAWGVKAVDVNSVSSGGIGGLVGLYYDGTAKGYAAAESAGVILQAQSNGTVKINTGGTGAVTLGNATGGATFAGAVAIGNTVAVAVAVASTHKVTMVIGGVTYYLLASNV